MNKKREGLILWILVILLLVGNLTVAGYLLIKNSEKDIAMKEAIPECSDEPEDVVNIDDKEVKNSETSELKEFQSQGERIISKSSDITVSWEYFGQKCDNGDIFEDNRFDKILEECVKENKEYDNQYFSYCITTIGVVSSGIYSGDNVYEFTCGEPGMGGIYGPTVIAVKNNDDFIVLNNYSDDDAYFMKNYAVIDNGTMIKTNDIPDEIAITGSKIKFIEGKETKIWDYISSKDEEITPVFKYDDENFLYRDTENCYYIKTGDGKVEYNFPESFFVMDYIKKNGEKNEDIYSYQSYSECGSMNCYNYSDVTKENLDRIGETSIGVDVFRLKYNNDAIKKYENIYVNEYYSYGKEKISYNEFLASEPLLYIEDPLGNIIELKKSIYMPAVECGKPVIYLYPEQEMNVRVFVEPDGGLSITEPEYNKENGWFVKAQPNGDLYNYENGTNYDYLFWEGYGLNYKRGKEGFVVSREDMKDFLDDKLIKLGLIKKEADEFIEFWLPRMQEKEFYFITFMSKEDFDKIAPLNIIPKPDTVIRVFMDFEGLDEKIDVVEQEIITPDRKGFTVAEWGGALH
ncbi:MAG: hypothetical protein PF488_04325 [Patescibacteria group bacterium]|jgi:hypothetical protein|nr:hypothetical protein [Patescibacteria group bacterium]